MKIGLYARVSDDKRKLDGDRRQDVSRQVDMLTAHIKKEFAQQPQETEIKTYIDDGKTAFTEDWNQRPAFKQLFNDCRRHFIDKIYIEDMTRFSRRLDFGLTLLKELSELNVHLVSLKEGELEVTSSKGWMQSSILLLFAEWSSRISSEKVRSGMAKAKSEGKNIGRKKGGSG
jgi:DNA invertase Pin-like site-specific DNA recombinase